MFESDFNKFTLVLKDHSIGDFAEGRVLEHRPGFALGAGVAGRSYWSNK